MEKNPFFKQRASKKDTHSKVTDNNTSPVAAKSPSVTKDIAKTVVERALEVVDNEIHCFLSPLNEPYCDIRIDGHTETYPINSSQVRQYVRIRYHEDTKGHISKQRTEEIVELLGAKARFRGKVEKLDIRIAGDDSVIYIDLCNPGRDVVKITSEGWEVIKNAPVHFIRTQSMAELAPPQRGGNIRELKYFLNLKSEDDYSLFYAWALRALSPRKPYPILLLKGPPGSAKSTLMVSSRSIVDPSHSPNRSMPKNDRDLFVAAHNNWALSFDNLSYCPKWLSDRLCLIATGGGFATRKNYTDLEETIINVSRPIILIGIENVATQKDLIQRSIILELPEIDEAARIAESRFYGEFMKALPRIFGAFCDILSVILRNIGSVTTRDLPRMADFARWVLAAESALPFSGKEFLNIYRANQRKLINIVSETDPLARAVMSLMTNRTEWKGTAADTIRNLEKQPAITGHVTNSSSWPKAPNKLRSCLMNVEDYLLDNGIRMEFGLKEDGGTRKLKFVKVQETVVTDPIEKDSAVEPRQPEKSCLTEEDESECTYTSIFTPEEVAFWESQARKGPKVKKMPVEDEEDAGYESIF